LKFKRECKQNRKKNIQPKKTEREQKKYKLNICQEQSITLIMDYENPSDSHLQVSLIVSNQAQ
jgi:hypothetical protein